LPAGAPEWQLRDWAEEAGYPCGLWVSLRSPYLLLPKSYDAVEKALDGKFRQNLRRRKRRLAEKGEIKYALVDGKDAKALDAALADFFEIEAGGWKGKDGTAIAQRPALVGFYTQIARDAAKRGALALGTMTLGGLRRLAHTACAVAEGLTWRTRRSDCGWRKARARRPRRRGGRFRACRRPGRTCCSRGSPPRCRWSFLSTSRACATAISRGTPSGMPSSSSGSPARRCSCPPITTASSWRRCS